MPTSIVWKLNAEIASGPGAALASAVVVDAYDRISVTVPHTAANPPNEVEVDVQPGAAGRVRFLLIRSSDYGANLKFKVHDAANPAHVLDDSLFLVGAGGVGLLESPIDKLFVINTLGHAATLEILVGRQAVP